MADSNRFISTGDAQSAREALRRGEFVPHFQPIVHLRSGQLAGFEILARWQHPQFGQVPPDQFIPLAEEQGWIGELTQQLLEKAFAEAASIPAPLTLSVNISPLQLRDRSLPRLIQDAVKGTGFDLKRLIVEITESALCEKLERAQGIARELTEMGCSLSLDDFGTGYSSLFHLQSLPFGEMKVDRSFVSSMTEKRSSRKIVSAVIGLGQSLGLRTVAEGIEGREQAEMMLWLGCDMGQGWYYGRPVPAQDLASVVATSRQKLPTSEFSPWKKIVAAHLDGEPSQRLAHLQAVYDGAPVGLALVSKDLRYLNLNKKLADMNGRPAECHIGSRLADMIPDIFPALEPHLRRALRGESVAEVEVTTSEGFTRLCSYQPARDEAGEIIALSVSVLDITQRRRAQQSSCGKAEICPNRLEGGALSWPERTTPPSSQRLPEAAKERLQPLSRQRRGPLHSTWSRLRTICRFLIHGDPSVLDVAENDSQP